MAQVPALEWLFRVADSPVVIGLSNLLAVLVAFIVIKTFLLNGWYRVVVTIVAGASSYQVLDLAAHLLRLDTVPVVVFALHVFGPAAVVVVLSHDLRAERVGL